MYCNNMTICVLITTTDKISPEESGPWGSRPTCVLFERWKVLTSAQNLHCLGDFGDEIPGYVGRGLEIINHLIRIPGFLWKTTIIKDSVHMKHLLLLAITGEFWTGHRRKKIQREGWQIFCWRCGSRKQQPLLESFCNQFLGPVQALGPWTGKSTWMMVGRSCQTTLQHFVGKLWNGLKISLLVMVFEYQKLSSLGGRFKYFLFSILFGEMI